MTKVYDLYEFGEHIATGSVVELAEVTELSTPRLYQIASSGNPKYTLTHIGNYKAVYALYEHDVYKASGTIEQLSKLTGKKEANLIWMSNSASLNRNPSTILIRIEGEKELVANKKIYRWKENIYKIMRFGMTYRGTTNELTELLNVTPSAVRKDSKVIGIRHLKIKAVNQMTMESYSGNLEGVSQKINRTTTAVQRALKKEVETAGFKIYDTGEFIDEMFEPRPQKQVKPPVRTPQRTPVTPMSDYTLELLEWSTRHLRRDA